MKMGASNGPLAEPVAFTSLQQALVEIMTKAQGYGPVNLSLLRCRALLPSCRCGTGDQHETLAPQVAQINPFCEAHPRRSSVPKHANQAALEVARESERSGGFAVDSEVLPPARPPVVFAVRPKVRPRDHPCAGV